ncbi:MAG: hypothetical protein U0904_06830 [Candidatus Nanopelagicales bacterium]|nr:hypothetical protein [Candidatus Nanopelagicales bacterium]
MTILISEPLGVLITFAVLTLCFASTAAVEGGLGRPDQRRQLLIATACSVLVWGAIVIIRFIEIG